MRAQILLDPNLLRKERRGREKESAQKRALTLLSPFSRARSNFFRESRESNSFHNDNDENTPEASIREQKRRIEAFFVTARARARLCARIKRDALASSLSRASFSILNLFVLGEKERRHKTRLVSVLLYLVVVLVAEDNGCGRAEECEE